MIALCEQHHSRAGGGAFTVEQLHELKVKALSRAREARGSFDWMRHKVVVVTGGGVYSSNGPVFEFNGRKVVWFNRNDDGYMLLNIRMITASGKPRFLMEDNFWVAEGAPVDIVCPPQSPRIDVSYRNGDRLSLQFRELQSASDARSKHPMVNGDIWETMAFPLTSVEVEMIAPGAVAEFGRNEMRIGNIIFQGCSAINLSPNGRAIYVGPPIPEVQSPFYPGITTPPPRAED